MRCCSCELVFMNPFLTDARLLCNKLIAVQSTEIPSSFPQRRCTTKRIPTVDCFPASQLRCVALGLRRHCPTVLLLSLQQLLKMRDDLKERELELEKSLEDKLQLKSQVQNLKEGLQKLQNSQVSFTRTLCSCETLGSGPAEETPSVCRASSVCESSFVRH